MLQEVIRQAVEDDPELELAGELATAEGLPGLWRRTDADVVIIRPLTADVPAAVLPEAPDARIPAVVGVDQHGTRGLILLHDISRNGLKAAIRAAAELSRTQGDRLIMCRAHRASSDTQPVSARAGLISAVRSGPDGSSPAAGSSSQACPSDCHGDGGGRDGGWGDRGGAAA